MNLDATVHKGSEDKPAVIFIHGLGMDKSIWENPSASRILGGRFPIKILLGKRPSVRDFGICSEAPLIPGARFSTGEQPDNIRTLFHDLRLRGYTVIAWSQKRPAGPIDTAVSELNSIINIAGTMTKAGIVLIGHSRGGLIGRKYLLKKDKSIRALITISTPHRGSSIARTANYLSPLVSVISPLFPAGEKGTLSFTIKHILEFLRSRAIKELLPKSKFLKSLKDGPSDWTQYVSVGGTDPTLFSLYRWQWDTVKEGEKLRWLLKPDELFSIPNIFERVIPEKVYPEELKKGKGDGLVSAESSKLPWSYEHYNFELNHAEILFDEEVRGLLTKKIQDLFF